jgi:hypothetical protein
LLLNPYSERSRLPLWFRVARIWLPLALAVTATCGLVAVTVQQNYRAGLNDPQIQLARDAAALLDSGAEPASVVNSPTVDAERSLAPFVIVYSPSNAVLASGATLGGATPTPPRGVLQAARSGAGKGRIAGLTGNARPGENRVTWQPRDGVRLASVGVAAKSGVVVLAARNMSEVEGRESDLMTLVALGWLAAVGGALAAAVVIEVLGGRVRKSERG